MSRFIRWKQTNPDDYRAMMEERKRRYAEDPDYRERQLKHTAEWRKKQKQKPKAAKRPKKRPLNPRYIEVDGKQVELWSAGRVADYLGVCKRTLTNLEEMGTIPINRALIKRRRWWPADYVQWLKPFFDARKTGISAQEFHRRVWTAWTEAQETGAVIALPLTRSENEDAGSIEEGSG